MSLGCLNCSVLIMDGQFCSETCEREFLTKCREMKVYGDWLDREQERRQEMTDVYEQHRSKEEKS